MFRKTDEDGNVIRVPVDTLYYGIWVEDISGLNERCLVLTKVELLRLSMVVSEDLDHFFTPGRLYSAVISGRLGYFIKLLEKRRTYTVFMTKRAFDKYEARAEKCPEYVAKKSLLADLID